MAYRNAAPTAARRTSSTAPSRTFDVPTIGITIYGCGPDEAALFEATAPRFGVTPTITEAAPSAANTDLAIGSRCVSVGHQCQITAPILLALSRAGVTYLSTRSIGSNHIDVAYAESVGISVGNVTYSPDSVADFTLMLMLMAVRNAQATIARAAVHDYRLHDVRGRELRDLTVGVIGTGRIGAAVIARLRGFGCRILTHDRRPRGSTNEVSLEHLLQRSDIATLHTPLTDETHHLLCRRRIELMKRDAFIVNTGRGSLLDTEALVDALEKGALGGAALDVVEGEDGIFYADCSDRPIENQLLLRLHRLPNVIISPHTAYFTDHSLRDTVECSLRNCVRFEGSRQHG